MSDTVPLSVLKDQPGAQGLAQLGRNALERITELECELAEAKEELNDRRKFAYAVEQALDGLKSDYVEIIVALRKDAERYRRLNNDAFN